MPAKAGIQATLTELRIPAPERVKELALLLGL